MKKFFRTLLLLLLAIALPMQGYAASSAVCCTGKPAQLSQLPQFTQLHAHCTMSADASPQTDKQHAEPQTHEHSYQQMSGDMKSTTAQHCNNCSHCAAGCAGMALMPVLPQLALLAPSSEKIEQLFSSRVGFLADAPERPPKI